MSLWTWVGQNVGLVAEVFTGLTIAAFAWAQWSISRQDEARHRQAEQEARQIEVAAEDARRKVHDAAEAARQEADKLQQARQRDALMAVWGAEVIDLMANLEVFCYPLAADLTPKASDFDVVSAKASALVDRGRMFFPNVKSGEDPDGIRVQLLDHVLRACYVARLMATEGGGRDRMMRHQVWQARRRFVTLLQDEMRHSLRSVKEESAGTGVLLDPRQWREPSIPLKLLQRAEVL